MFWRYRGLLHHHQISRFLSALPLMCNSRVCLKGVFMWRRSQWLPNCSEKQKKERKKPKQKRMMWITGENECASGKMETVFLTFKCVVANYFTGLCCKPRGYRLFRQLATQQMTQNQKWRREEKADCSLLPFERKADYSPWLARSVTRAFFIFWLLPDN